MGAPSAHDEHIRQAWAWLHGHAWIDDIPVHEEFLWRGHFYEVHPPLGAVVCVPFLLMGVFNQTIISCSLGAVAVSVAYLLTGSVWLTVFFASTVWYETTLGWCWGFLLVLSTISTMLALTRKSALATGFWAGLAALARYDLVMVWPIYIALGRGAVIRGCQTPSTGNLGGPVPALKRIFLLPGLIFATICYILYAYWRFGTFHDIGLEQWYAIDPYSKIANHGPFSLYYLSYNLYTAFLMPPHFTAAFPWVRPQMSGQALLFTSPALLIAVRAWRNWSMWLAIVFSMSGAMLVWSNGAEQFGARYWIQSMPFFLVLMKEGWRDCWLDKTLVVLSVIFVGTGMLTIRFYGFA